MNNEQNEVYEIVKVPSMLRLSLREIKADKFALVSAIIIFLILATVIIAAPIVTTESATRVNMQNVNSPPSWQGGTEGYLLGTDQGGRNIFFLLIVSARNSLIIGFGVAIIAIIIGFVIGIISGYFGGWIDMVIMRLVDTWMMIPTLVFIIAMTTVLPRTIWNLIFLLVAFAWLGRARLIRNVTLQQINMDYVAASKTLGTRNPIIMLREIVPNLVPVLAPDIVLAMSTTIGVETGLSMLGFGLPIETPSIGTLINNAMVMINLQHRWWNWFPAIALLFIISLSINFVGQAIQRVADPRQRMV